LATAISATPKHPPITEAEAEVYLARDLQSALAATLRYCPVLATEPEKRLAAIVDFTFNLGAGRLQTSTLRRRINQRDWSPPGAVSVCGKESAASHSAR
jgi:lysozyme